MADASPRVFNVLFLCTGNSARSIIAESVLRKEGGERFRAFSAGSQPKAEIHPRTLKILQSYHYSTEGLRSKSWDEFSGADAPMMDFVFTVCDNAAGETCPYWPGKPMTAHWGVADPAAETGSDLQRDMAFIDTLRYMKARIRAFAALPISTLDRASLASKLHEIGQTEGTTGAADSLDVIIYHNPECGTSRNTLAMIRNAGIEPHVIEYLKTPPSRAMLERLIARMGIGPRNLLRENGTPYGDLGLDNPNLTDAALIEAMMAHPILINRPIVISPRGVRLCRPSEQVLDLLPPHRAAFRKEDGEQVVDAQGNRTHTA